MKKTVLLSACVLLASCQTTPPAESVEAEAVSEVSAGMPCSYSCMPNNPCMQTLEPLILRPRVLEVEGQPAKRPCCNDEPKFGNLKVYVPDAPEIYVISANRTVNSMLKEAAPFYEQAGTMRVYIDAANFKAADLPGGIEQGTKTLKKRFSEISNVIVTDKLADAQYVVSSQADWFDTATKKVPAIKYDLFLKSGDGRLIGEWSEIIHQAAGDRSWW